MLNLHVLVLLYVAISTFSTTQDQWITQSIEVTFLLVLIMQDWESMPLNQHSVVRAIPFNNVWGAQTNLGGRGGGGSERKIGKEGWGV